jgi:hypothetical protein
MTNEKDLPTALRSCSEVLQGFIGNIPGGSDRETFGLGCDLILQAADILEDTQKKLDEEILNSSLKDLTIQELRNSLMSINQKGDIMIKPTVGRMVYFRPSIFTNSEYFAMPLDTEPCAAIIVRVWDDHLVNLSIFDANGTPHAMTSVPLIQEGEPKPEDGFFCYWMPFQIGQAVKTAEVEAKLAKISEAVNVDGDTSALDAEKYQPKAPQ